MATYRPKFRKQGDGSRCQWQNCNCTSHAMAVDRWTRGVTVGSQVAIRNYINLYCPGTSFAQNRNATSHLYNISLEYHWGDSWANFVAGIQAGRGAVVGMLYAPLHGTPYDACRTFSGRHAIFINEWRYNATLGRSEFLVFDPLADHRYSWVPQGPQWWPASLLKTVMEKYSAGTLEWAFTRNTEWVNRKTNHIALLRTSTITSSANVVATVPVGTVLYTAVSAVIGGSWTIGVTKNTWYKATAVNGKSTTALYGVPAVYIPTGWF